MAGNDDRALRHAEATLKVYKSALAAECEGDGWAIITTEEGRRERGKCPECARERMDQQILRFIPPRFQASISVPDAAVAWAERGQDAQGLYLTGPVGTGKTHAAWMAVGMWCRYTRTEPWIPRTQGIEGWSNAGPTVIFSRMTDLLDDLRPGDGAHQRVRDCQTTKLLVIDDIGAEKPSEWTQERLYSIVDHRYSSCLPLIVTSNLPPGKLADTAGERTASRLAEMCTVVPMTGTDRRKP